MEQRSQAQAIADQLASRVGQLELEKAISYASLEAARYENDALREEIKQLRQESGKNSN